MGTGPGLGASGVVLIVNGSCPGPMGEHIDKERDVIDVQIIAGISWNTNSFQSHIVAREHVQVVERIRVSRQAIP